MTDGPSVDDAIGVILDLIRKRRPEIIALGYDVYLPGAWNIYAIESGMVLAGDRDALLRIGPQVSATFSAAGWELCRRGILRPGVQNVESQSPLSAVPDRGYSITPAGKRWLAAADPLLYVPTDPSRLAQILAGFSPKFGPGFGQRAEEAVRCYNALAYLACCAMCGAAAESILLAVAIDRRGDADPVLRDYRASGGRARVEKNLLGQVGEPTSSRFRTFMDLLNYWRDDSSHGTFSTIADLEAFDALSRLMRFARFATDQWVVLTGKKQSG
jgi:hypothetical protein